jgi:hypothetical protein
VTRSRDLVNSALEDVSCERKVESILQFLEIFACESFFRRLRNLLYFQKMFLDRPKMRSEILKINNHDRMYFKLFSLIELAKVEAFCKQ